MTASDAARLSGGTTPPANRAWLAGVAATIIAFAEAAVLLDSRHAMMIAPTLVLAPLAALGVAAVVGPRAEVVFGASLAASAGGLGFWAWKLTSAAVGTDLYMKGGVFGEGWSFAGALTGALLYGGALAGTLLLKDRGAKVDRAVRIVAAGVVLFALTMAARGYRAHASRPMRDAWIATTLVAPHPTVGEDHGRPFADLPAGRVWTDECDPHLGPTTIGHDPSLDVYVVGCSRQIDNYYRYVVVTGYLRGPRAAPGFDPAATAGGMRFATRIQNSAKRMVRIVDDLLDLTRTRLGSEIHIFRRPMNAGSVCEMVIAELEGSHPHAAIRYTAKGDLCGEWDSDRLAQVMSNLVGNALVHGDTDKHISVVAQGHGEEIALSINNAGLPIPESALKNIFEPNVRNVGETAKAPGGLGLGLYIAKALVTAHGGTLGVTSTDASGTTFTVRLPRHVELEKKARENLGNSPKQVRQAGAAS